MKVSAKAEYACVAMMELAANYKDSQPIRIRSIADAHGIPQRFLVQILLQMKTAGLVASIRGAAGGYQLARAPEKITLADILNAVEDRSTTNRSVLSDSHTPAARTLMLVWKELQVEEQRLLDNLSLADVLRRSRASADLTYHI